MTLLHICKPLLSRFQPSGGHASLLGIFDLSSLFFESGAILGVRQSQASLELADRVRTGPLHIGQLPIVVPQISVVDARLSRIRNALLQLLDIEILMRLDGVLGEFTEHIGMRGKRHVLC